MDMDMDMNMDMNMNMDMAVHASPHSDAASSHPSTPAASPMSPDAIASAPLKSAPSAQPPSASRRPTPVVLGGLGAAALLVIALLARSGGGAAATTPASAGPGGAPASPAGRPASAAASAAASFTQTWSGANSAYWVGNRRKSAAFELPAETIVPVWTRSVRPTLVVRCMGQSTQVFVVTESPMKIEPQTEDHTVTYSIDGEPAVSERWPDSDEHDALFAPDGAAFARRLMHARTFRFGFTPHNVPSVATDFNVGGLAALLEPVSKECGWKK
jgi:hypothetical protein